MSQTPNISIPVMNMSCGGCVGRAARALEAVEGIEGVTVNLADETAHFSADDDQAKTKAITALDQAGYPAATQTLTLAITGMSCASCVGRLDKALQAVPGVVEAQVNLADETAHLRYVAGITSPAELMAASADAGYPGTVLEQGQMPGPRRRQGRRGRNPQTRNDPRDGSRGCRFSFWKWAVTWCLRCITSLGAPLGIRPVGSSSLSLRPLS